MSDSAVLYSLEDHIATVTLNRPENRNSMTPDVLEGLAAAIARAREDREVRCIVLTGRGKSFCAGADFKSRGGESVEAPHERSYKLYSHFLSLLDVEVPVVAALNGHAIGGGLGLAVVCDLRVANRAAKYGANFVGLGMHPGMPTTYWLPRLMGVPKATELLLTGRLVDGGEAETSGLVHYAVEPEAVLDKAMDLAREIATAAPLAVRWTKQTIYHHLEWDPRSAAQFEAHVQSRTLETEDCKEGVKALLEKRDPAFRGREFRLSGAAWGWGILRPASKPSARCASAGLGHAGRFRLSNLKALSAWVTATDPISGNADRRVSKRARNLFPRAGRASKAVQERKSG